jgi:rRNA pseudouridine-1189 N-methylase Emg1 (Nep1/Mra1 family)
MEQLLVNGSVPVNGEHLMQLSRATLRDQMQRKEPSRIIALTSHGEKSSFPDVATVLADEVAPTVFIGAYPKGSMSPEVLELADDVYSVYPESLEAWTITSRILYEYEKLIIL